MAQHDINSVQNGGQVRHHLIRPEAQHAKAVALKPGGAARVMRSLLRFAMLTAINLDHQPCRQANEIGEKWPQGKLTAKAETVDLFAFQRMPKFLFGVRSVCAKLARE